MRKSCVKPNSIYLHKKTNFQKTIPFNFFSIRPKTYFAKFCPGDNVFDTISGSNGVVMNIVESGKASKDHSVAFRFSNNTHKIEEKLISDSELYKIEDQFKDDQLIEFEARYCVGDLVEHRNFPDLLGKVIYIIYRNETVYYGLRMFGEENGIPREDQVFWEKFLKKIS